MASRVVGIDLGAYSIKVAVAQPGFRSATISEFVERPVPPGDEPHLERATRVLGNIIREYGLAEDSHYVAIAGDQVFIHILEFPFKNLRRADLARAVGAELEEVLPIDLEDMVYAFEPIPRAVIPPVGEGDPEFAAGPAQGMVAEPAEGMRVLACAMHSERAREILERLEDAGVDARGLVAAPESYSRIMDRIPSVAGSGPYAVIDVGHARTDVCVIAEGRTVYARTITRGGRDLTDTIARSWNLSRAQAEDAKHRDGFVGSSSQPPPTEAWQRIHDALIPEIAPLSRDLRQTFIACRAKVGVTISRAILIGGGSRLRGLPEFLSERLGVPVSLLSAADHEAILGGRQAAGADVACLAVGVAYEGATGRPLFDLRQGELAYKADLSVLREKAMPLLAALLTIVAFATVAGFAKMRSLKQTEKVLAERLAVESTEVFGKQLDADEVLARTIESGSGNSPLPKRTAYDLVLRINDALPGRDAVNIDVRDLSIKAGKITLEILSRPTDKLQASEGITEVEKALKNVDCFESIARGDSTTESDDAKRVTLTIAVKEKCR